MPLADGLCSDDRVRTQLGCIRQRKAAIQYDQLDGAADVKRPVVLRTVRARADFRANPRQDRRGTKANGQAGCRYLDTPSMDEAASFGSTKPKPTRSAKSMISTSSTGNTDHEPATARSGNLGKTVVPS